MDDLISRQAAIDALEEAKKQYIDRRVIIGKMQDIINNLPSAQPEITIDQVNEYCNEKGFVILPIDQYQWLKSLKSKAEEFRWNGGGNY